MTVSRGFLVIGPIYLIVGVLMGMYMGGSGDHTMQPVHAHINLLGFTLMMLFGLTYGRYPEAGASGLGRAHFWLHQIGSIVLLVMLLMLFSGNIGEEAMFPIAPIAELAVLLGVVCFAVNMWRHAL